MRLPLLFLRVGTLVILGLAPVDSRAAEPPVEWIDPDTGHRVVRLSQQPGTASLYFHQYPYSADGRTVWYDLQTPKSGVFWLAGVDLETGERTWYPVRRENWSVHFNVSPDGSLFAGDGGGPESVAARGPDGRRLDPPGNGPWIHLFRPVKVANPASVFPEQGNLIRTGYLESERLVNLAKHNYRLEPNVTFTPDGKWIVFRSNLHGAVHTYAVEVARPMPGGSRPNAE